MLPGYGPQNDDFCRLMLHLLAAPNGTAEGPDPSGRPFDRVARVDGRSDDVLRLPGINGGRVVVHPYRLRAPFVRLLDVLQYQVVHRADGVLVRVVVRSGAERDVAERVRGSGDGAQ